MHQANFHSIKKASTDSTMDLDNICKVVAITSVIQGIKVEDVTCATDIASILKIADRFLTRVAQNPQRTCVASYTSKLFGNYMQYKHLSEKAQDIIYHRDKYMNTLTRHPEANNPKDELVYGIINEALSESPQPGYSPSETSSGVEELHTSWTSDLDSASLSGRSLVFRGKTEPSTDLAMRVLVLSEVWADLLPVKIDHPTSLIYQKTQTVPAFNVKYKRFHILATVCGTHDVAVKLREWVSVGQTGDRLVIPIKDISTLENREYRGAQGQRPTSRSSTNLPIGPYNATFVHPSRSTCFILGVTYGGKIYSSSEELRRFVDNADHGTPRDWLYIHFNRETIKDEHLGKNGMTGVVFDTYSILNGVQSAVSMGTAGFVLVDQRQLATVTKETVNGANDNLLKKDSKEVKTYRITLGKGIEAPGYSCTFQSGTLKVSPSETPFMQFKNGVKFALRKNGRFEVLDKQDEVFWSSEEVPEGQIPRRLEFCKDGKLRLWNTDEQVHWTPLMNFTRCERKMVFSSEFPHLEIYNSEGEPD
ncbi:uncharacterized protein FRV6_11509 [Fusarium oxysporum]|uniref:Bulb-type lectin domain-containing protein n=1 Tax=Fusarium oxysporum TaxID=5507 RepID=A0A2H3TFE3_FUSOX|nr:uncharacterized protein FRV6_11509 [Fusarium oxysporum]